MKNIVAHVKLPFVAFLTSSLSRFWGLSGSGGDSKKNEACAVDEIANKLSTDFEVTMLLVYIATEN